MTFDTIAWVVLIAVAGLPLCRGLTPIRSCVDAMAGQVEYAWQFLVNAMTPKRST